MAKASQSRFLMCRKEFWFIFLFYTCWTRPTDGTGSSGCEKEGPCGPDQFCSPSRSICRNCEDIVQVCRNRTTILHRFPTCDAFCYKLQLEEANRKLAEVEEKNENLTAIIDGQSVTTVDNLSSTIISTIAGPSAGFHGKKLDTLHYILMAVICGLLIMSIAAFILLCRAKRSSRGSTSGPLTVCEDRELQPLVVEAVPSTVVPTAPPVTDGLEDGYETGVSGSNASTPRQSGPRRSEQPSQTTDQGHDIYIPTSEDVAPPQLALP